VNAEKHYNGQLETFAFPLVPDDVELSSAFFAQLMREQWDLVVGTSYGFQYAMYPLTSLFPSTFFLHISGDLQYGNGMVFLLLFLSSFLFLLTSFFFIVQSETNPNWALGFAKIHHSRYLTGYLAGLTTKNGRIGNIAAVPIPEARVYIFHNKKFGKKTHKRQTISFSPRLTMESMHFMLV